MCNKKPYEDFWSARQGLVAVRVKFLRHGKKPPTGIHPCSECRGWHLTSRGGYLKPPWQDPVPG
jgi:hypothetical protein